MKKGFHFFLAVVGGLLFLLLGLQPLAAHEKTPAFLRLVQQNDTLSGYFKAPINPENGQVLSVQFPSHWEVLDRTASQLGNERLLDFRFVAKSDASDSIAIQRPEGIASVLIYSASNGSGEQTLIISKDQPHFAVQSTVAAAWQTFLEFLILGIEHILIGWDHLLFVLAIVFLVKGRMLIACITSFTLAHSITLALSTFAYVTLPGAVVEALIAFSIVLLAAEMLQQQRNKTASKSYVFITFSFGLLHGFGFAGVLSEIGLPENSLFNALLSFNLGVEIGQLLFIGIIFLVGGVLYRLLNPNAIRAVSAVLIGCTGGYWLVERVVGMF